MRNQSASKATLRLRWLALLGVLVLSSACHDEEAEKKKLADIQKQADEKIQSIQKQADQRVADAEKRAQVAREEAARAEITLTQAQAEAAKAAAHVGKQPA